MKGLSPPVAADVAGFAGGGPFAKAQGIHVFAAGAAKEVVIRIVPGFTLETGIGVAPVYDTVGALRDRLLRGERCDVALLSRAAVDTLEGRGLIAAGSRSALGSVAIAVAVKKGAFLPDISTPTALKEALLGVKSISYADPAFGATAGGHFALVLDRLGIRDRVADRLTVLPFGVDVIRAVADGRFELGVSQSSEILLHPGVTLAGPLPEPYALLTPYEVVILKGAKDGAKPFVDFLQPKGGADAWAEAGFQRE